MSRYSSLPFLPEENLLNIALQFAPPGSSIQGIERLGNGLINRSFQVELQHGPPKKFILQQLNQEVFSQPALITRNIQEISQYLAAQPPRPVSGSRFSSLRLPQLMKSRHNHDHFEDQDGNYWRALTFIDQAQCFDTIQNDRHAFEVGRALGTFHAMLIDLPIAKLAETIKDFHNTPFYLAELQRVLHQDHPLISPDPDTAFCLQFVHEREAQASVLEKAFQKGALAKRPIHGDPKINNFMVDAESGKVVSLIDLDTVQPGLVLYDIGDCLRSGCNTRSEDHEDWRAVSFDLKRCAKILSGYLATAGEALTQNDLAWMLDAILLIPFELGIRFLTDHLKGNVYFQTKHPRHNLQRALVQFQLRRSIEEQTAALTEIIGAAR